MTKHFSTAILAVFIAVGVGSTASAERLSDLIDNGGSLQIGDKLFSDFSYQFTGDMPSANGVNVITFTDDAGNPGLRFQGGFIDLPGGDSSDALIGYKVTVLDPDFAITDAFIEGNPALNNVSEPGDGFVGVTETYARQPNQMTIFDQAAGTKLSDSTTFAAPVTMLSVRKDILGLAQTTAVTLSQVDQTFQQVPEPTSAALALIAGIGATFFVRRRKR